METLAEALRFAEAEQLDVAVVGLGSNLLVADAGFDGLVVRLDGALSAIELDGARAIRLVRSRAGEFGVDPRKIGVWGFSAGGHLAGFLASEPAAG